MFTIIDVARNVEGFAPAIAARGITTVIRYYNHRNSSRLPDKALSRAELAALTGAGLSVAIVFQQNGGAGGQISDFHSGKGDRDARRALQLAEMLGQPSGSAIYFAVDWDYVAPAHVQAISGYFAEIGARLRPAGFRVGVYGSGLICGRMLDAGLADLAWLAAATGWSGHAAFLREGRWALAQLPPQDWPGRAFIHSGNRANPALADFGQFGGTARTGQENDLIAAPLDRVIAASGLNLRRGPGLEYDVIRTLPVGTLVSTLAVQDNWTLIAAPSGDGEAAGYVHSRYLQRLAGGLPAPVRIPARPIDIAQAEMQIGVAEVPGPGNNPRILMYHATTRTPASEDRVAWCSAFVNYCVQTAGLSGTRSLWAQDWHNWGVPASAPKRGDIAVFRRVNAEGKVGGHVGFLIEMNDDQLTILGGNQSGRVHISTYPRDGTAGGQKFTLMSIRHVPEVSHVAA